MARSRRVADMPGVTASPPSRRRLRSLLAGTLLALAPQVVAQRYVSEHFDERDGMASAQVHCLAQHGDGSLWIGTRAGLLRHDGRGFQRLPDPWGASWPEFLAIDASGVGWSIDAGATLGLVRHERERAVVLDLPPALAAAGTRIVGLQCLDGGLVALVSAEAGVHLRDDAGRWSHPAGGPTGRLWSSLATSNGLYVAGDDGLSRLRSGRWAHDLAPAAGLPDEGLLALAHGEANQIWVAGDGWVGVLDGDGGRVLASDASFQLGAHSRAVGQAPVLASDGTGGAWLASTGVLAHLEADGSAERLGGASGLPGEGAEALLRDREGNLWVGSLRGLSRLGSLRFRNWDRRDGLLADEVTAILEHPPGTLIVGHNEGLSRWDASGVSVLLAAPSGLQHNEDTRCQELALGHDGTLWVARARAGLQALEPGRPPRRAELRWRDEDLFVSSVAVDDGGRLWVGTAAGLFQGDGREFTRVESPYIAEDCAVRRVVVAGDEILLGTGERGAVRLHDGRWERFAHRDDKRGDQVYALRRTADGRLLAGTAAGLLEARDGELVPPSPPALAVSEAVYFLLDDPEGRLWIGTRLGLCVWDGHDLRRFGPDQGLPGLETNRAAACLDHRGRLWFGTVGGLSLYRPAHDQDERERPPPVVAWEQVEDGGRSLRLDRPVKLDSAQHDLLFRFHAVSFAGGDALQYRLAARGPREIHVDGPALAGGQWRATGLAPGTWRLALSARRSDGPWSAEVLSPPIEILRPWWQRWWALTLAALLAGGLTLGVLRHLVQRRRGRELERLVAERTRALAAAEQRYREMFHKNGVAQVLLDPERGRVLAVNPAAEREWQVAPGGLTGLALEELLDPAPAEALAVLLAVPEGGSAAVTCSRSGAGGDLRQLELSACAYELDGRRAVHVSVHDVTERRRAEELEAQSQKMESVGRLAGGVAHDFNNVLTALLGHAEQARRALPDALCADEHMAQVVDVARRGARLTSQLLGFARSQPSSPQVLCPGDFLQGLLSLLRRVVRESVTLELRVDPLAGNVVIDPVQLEQVLLNLVVNGADAMPGGGRLVLAVSPGTPGGGPRKGQPGDEWVDVSVADSGTGIAPAVLPRVFEPFFTTKPVGRGTGLGLATCQGIAQQNGGLMEVETADGAGSTFHLLLPRVDAPVPAVLGVQAAAATPEPARRPATVLLVEDEPMVREVAAIALRRLGYEVLEAQDGLTALALARDGERRIDLLLTDVIMPGMSGSELAEALLSHRPGLAVLYASGYTADALPEPQTRPGAGALLSKPWSLDELASAVRRALESRPEDVPAGRT